MVYRKGGRMKELSLENQIYLCKYHDIIADYELRTTMGISRKQANDLIERYRANGLYKQYRNLQEDQYEAIIKKKVEAPKSNTDKLLEKYELDTSKPGYQYLKQVLEYLSLNKKNSILEAYQEIANQNKEIDELTVKNAIYRIVSEKKITLTQLLKNETEWVGPDKKGFVAIKEENAEEDINSEFIQETGNNELPDVDTGFVKVSIRTVMEWSYQKGYLDRMLEEEKKKEV